MPRTKPTQFLRYGVSSLKCIFNTLLLQFNCIHMMKWVLVFPIKIKSKITYTHTHTHTHTKFNQKVFLFFLFFRTLLPTILFLQSSIPMISFFDSYWHIITHHISEFKFSFITLSSIFILLNLMVISFFMFVLPQH